MADGDLGLMEVELSNSDLAMIYLALMARQSEYAAEDHPQTQRCRELAAIFAGAQKSNQIGILFAERTAGTSTPGTDTDA